MLPAIGSHWDHHLLKNCVGVNSIFSIHIMETARLHEMMLRVWGSRTYKCWKYLENRETAHGQADQMPDCPSHMVVTAHRFILKLIVVNETHFSFSPATVSCICARRCGSGALVNKSRGIAQELSQYIEVVVAIPAVQPVCIHGNSAGGLKATAYTNLQGVYTSYQGTKYVLASHSALFRPGVGIQTDGVVIGLAAQRRAAVV